MIRIIETTGNYTVRAQGWVQDASDFSNLKRLVSAFDNQSPLFAQTIDKINRLVSESDGRNLFLSKLNEEPIILKYKEIVGSSFIPRNQSRCNGIGQAALKGQSREFQVNWPTDNFLRWAVSLQFIAYDWINDTYQITAQGRSFTRTITEEQEKRILKEQFKYYSPIKRVLELIELQAKSKFSIGQDFGFIGEKGFTSIPEELYIQRYQNATQQERGLLRSDYEGSSDKYVRQICSWLEKLDLVVKRKRPILANNDNLTFFEITVEGKEYLRRIRLQNRFFVPFGMLSMDARNKELHKKRRALVIKFASEGRFTLQEITNRIALEGIHTDIYEIRDDVSSIDSCGIDMSVTTDCIVEINSEIFGLEIPSQIEIEPLDIVNQIKNELRPLLNHVNHRLLSIIDFSYNMSRGDDKRLEDYTAQVYRLISSETHLLAGANRPDVVCVIDNLGIIIDAKAYQQGFNIPRSEEDKMVRYLDESVHRDNLINSTRWWDSLGHSTEHVFQFVSSSFTEGALSKITQINRRTGKNGAVITTKNLLLLAENFLANNIINRDVFSQNQEIN